MLPQQLANLLKAAIASGGSEPDIVRNYVGAASAIPATPQHRVRAGFIHQRPYAFFVQPPTIAGREKCELGDILYVYKAIDRQGTLIEAKVTFVQAKKGTDSWSIEPHQLEFLSKIKEIQFRFGNSVYKRGGYVPKIYNGLPHTGDLSQYLLLDPTDALSYSVRRIKALQKLYQHGFSVRQANPIKCREGAPQCFQCDSHLEFLNRFCVGKDGSKLSGSLRAIVELVYKRIGWDLDPPEEFADNFIDDRRGFAILEITSSTDRPSKRERG